MGRGIPAAGARAFLLVPDPNPNPAPPLFCGGEEKPRLELASVALQVRCAAVGRLHEVAAKEVEAARQESTVCVCG